MNKNKKNQLVYHTHANSKSRSSTGPSDPPGGGTLKMCAWTSGNTIIAPDPLIYGESFVWTASFVCVQLCDDPHHKYFWNIYAWDPNAAGGAGDWACIYDWDNVVDGQLGTHGGTFTLPQPDAQEWWDDLSDYDLSKGIKFHCRVKCVVCRNSFETGAIVSVTGY